MSASHDDLRDRIAAWLDQRRSQLSRAFAANNLPQISVVEVPVVEFTEGGGYGLRMEQRNVSPLAAYGHPGLLEAIRPILDHPAEAIAHDLVAAAGENVRYVCNSGPALLQREMATPAIIEPLASQAPPFEFPQVTLQWAPAFYALMLLRMALFEYLETTGPLNVPQVERASNLAHELVGFALSPTTSYVCRIPVSGLAISGEVALGGVTVKPLSREEAGVLFSKRMGDFSSYGVARLLPLMEPRASWVTETTVVEVRKRVAKNVYYDIGQDGQRLLLALQLCGYDLGGAGRGAALPEPYWRSQGRSLYPLLGMSTSPAGTSRPFRVDDLSEAIAVTEQMARSRGTKLDGVRDLALRRFGLAVSREDPRDAVVDYAVALESVLLGGQDKGEARFRFAINGAVFTESEASARMKRYKDLLDIYDIRSILVHGGDPSSTRVVKRMQQLPALATLSRDVARGVLRKALEDGWPSDDDFVSALLDDAPEQLLRK